MTTPETICQQADRITTGERADVYGHPSVNFGNIAALWSTYLGQKITAEQVAVCQILVKIERLRHAPGHRDSVVDVAGYANCMGLILDRAVMPVTPQETPKKCACVPPPLKIICGPEYDKCPDCGGVYEHGTPQDGDLGKLPTIKNTPNSIPSVPYPRVEVPCHCNMADLHLDGLDTNGKKCCMNCYGAL